MRKKYLQKVEKSFKPEKMNLICDAFEKCFITNPTCFPDTLNEYLIE